jgi:hypothetical protein
MYTDRDLQQKPSVWRGVCAGAAGGLAGCFGMDLVSRLWTLASRGEITSREESLVQQGGRPEVEAAKKAALSAGDPGAVATTAIADRVAEAQGRPLSPKERTRGGQILHYSYGATMGALYGAGVEYFPSLRSQHGVLYGLLLWIAGVQVALPIAGLTAAPARYSSGEHVFSVASHAVFGLVAETTRSQIR